MSLWPDLDQSKSSPEIGLPKSDSSPRLFRDATAFSHFQTSSNPARCPCRNATPCFSLLFSVATLAICCLPYPSLGGAPCATQRATSIPQLRSPSLAPGAFTQCPLSLRILIAPSASISLSQPWRLHPMPPTSCTPSGSDLSSSPDTLVFLVDFFYFDRSGFIQASFDLNWSNQARTGFGLGSGMIFSKFFGLQPGPNLKFCGSGSGKDVAWLSQVLP